MNEIKMSSELTEMYVLKSNYEELEKENEELKKELSTYGATGVCETCTEKQMYYVINIGKYLRKYKRLQNTL